MIKNYVAFFLDLEGLYSIDLSKNYPLKAQEELINKGHRIFYSHQNLSKPNHTTLHKQTKISEKFLCTFNFFYPAGAAISILWSTGSRNTFYQSNCTNFKTFLAHCADLDVCCISESDNIKAPVWQMNFQRRLVHPEVVVRGH